MWTDNMYWLICTMISSLYLWCSAASYSSAGGEPRFNFTKAV
jgi:hypothetical protein